MAGLIQELGQDIESEIEKLTRGFLSSYFVPQASQKAWILQQTLVNSVIESISPTVPVRIVGADTASRRLIIAIQTPINLMPRELAEWEPHVILNGSCYSSPLKKLVISVNFPTDLDISGLKIYHPDSCLLSGTFVCESDAIIYRITGLEESNACDLPFGRRGKRSVDNLPTDTLQRHLGRLSEGSLVAHRAPHLYSEILEKRDKQMEEVSHSVGTNKILLYVVVSDILIGFALWALNKVRNHLLYKKRLRELEGKVSPI